MYLVMVGSARVARMGAARDSKRELLLLVCHDLFSVAVSMEMYMARDSVRDLAHMSLHGTSRTIV